MRLESSVPTRQPIFNIPAIVVFLLLLLVTIHVVREWLLPEDIDNDLVWALAFVPARYDSSALADGLFPGGAGADVWSFVTYALIHADWAHLGINAIWLAAFGSPLARRFGSVRFLALFLLTVAAGALAHLISSPGELVPVIGASAGISGAMAAAARFVFEPGGPLDGWRRDRSDVDRVPAAPLLDALRNPRVLTFLAVWFGLNLLFGLGAGSLSSSSQAVAWQAHIGGFVAGLLLFSAFDPIRPLAADD